MPTLPNRVIQNQKIDPGKKKSKGRKCNAPFNVFVKSSR